MYNKILIRYGELTTKGKNRMHFIKVLKNNLTYILKSEPEVQFDRMFLDYSQNNIDKLSYVFGISSYSPTIQGETNFDSIKRNACILVEQFLKGDASPTFKVVTKRNWKKFPMTSNELNINLGELISNKYNLKVDVKTPIMKIHIEIREKFTYLFCNKIKGAGGYPVGVNGKALMLLSGGIDSPVATYNLMKRGIKVEFLSFITPPHTDNKIIDKLKKIITLLNKYQGPSKLHLATFTEIMYLIEFVSKESYRITLMRRSFYRVAEIIAKKHNFIAIANGENLGQVASQTLESINAIQNAVDIVVFRPLLTADKQETIDLGRRIKTYDISIEKANESCELFAPKKPIIKPTIWESKRLESEIPELKEKEIKLIEKIKIIELN